jgi:hypothetical protein
MTDAEKPKRRFKVPRAAHRVEVSLTCSRCRRKKTVVGDSLRSISLAGWGGTTAEGLICPECRSQFR